MTDSDPASSNGDSVPGKVPLPEEIASVTPENDDALEAPIVGDEPDDRRSSPRRRKLLRVLVREESGSGESFTGWVVDRSLGGMCLSISREVRPGVVVSVRRHQGTSSTPWVELHVLNVRAVESTWEIGCEYVRTPSWETMLQFE